MNQEEIKTLTKFFKSTNDNTDETVLKFIKNNVYYFNREGLNLLKKNQDKEFLWAPRNIHYEEYDKINFWYFFVYLVFVYENVYINEIFTENNSCFHKGNSVDYVLDFMHDNSFVELIWELLCGYKSNDLSINNKIKEFLANLKYIPLICVKFISNRTYYSFFTIDAFKLQLKKEYRFFNQMVNNYFQKRSEETTDKSIEIPEDLKNLMNQIEKEF